MEKILKRIAVSAAVVLVAMVFLASSCHGKNGGSKVDPRCAQLFSHKNQSQTGIGAELSLKGYDVGKGKLDVNQVNTFQMEIDSLLTEHNTMSSNLCNMWANEVITKEVYASTQFCYDNNQRKLRTLVMGLKSGVVDNNKFYEELKLLFAEYDKCTPHVSSTPPPPSTGGNASNVQGAGCSSDKDCEPPLYCILGGCRTLGNVGEGCALDIDCNLPLYCSGGICTKGSSSVYGTACTSDANCQAPLFCILGTCRYLGNAGDTCGQTIDCYEPMVCTNGKCTSEAGPLMQYGVACGGDADCQAPLFCIKNTCRYLGNPGDACDYDYDCYSPYICVSGKCTASSPVTATTTTTPGVAVSGKTSWSATIKADVSIGAGGGGAKACAADDQCVKPDYCIVGYCRPLQPEGGVCNWNNDCQLYHTCVSGQCVKSATGSSCKSDNDCAPPNYCIVGSCSSLQGVGGVCNINGDCQAGLSCVGNTCVQ